MIDGDNKYKPRYKPRNEPLNESEKDLALSINLNVCFSDETRSMHRRRTLLKIVTISTAIATSTVTACIIRRMTNDRDLSMGWLPNAGR
jgi:hypothetical protein